MAQPEFRSPRKLAEEARLEHRARFERYMTMADEGIMERQVAVEALRDVLGLTGGADGIEVTGRDYQIPQE